MFAAMKAVASGDASVHDLDRSLLRENLKLSFEERARKHLRVLQMVEELRRAGKSCDKRAMAVALQMS